MPAGAYRILVVDDNEAVRKTFESILVRRPPDPRLEQAEALLFGAQAPDEPRRMVVANAAQGEEGVGMVLDAKHAGEPFALAFVDVRMPPGIDGIEAARRMWLVDPDIQIVICTAYSDRSWTEMAAQLGEPNRWVILKKPFDVVEVVQLAYSLTEKWTLLRRTRAQVADLEERVAARTADLNQALQQLQGEVAERERAAAERREIDRRLQETQRLESLAALSGGVAHDFNNILAAILMNASVARTIGSGGRDADACLARIETDSRRAAGLCEQLLAYAGKARIEMAATNLDAMVREASALLHTLVPADAELAMELAGGLPPIQADARKLRQVLVILVLNAAEALAAAPRKIRTVTGRATLDAAALANLARAGDAKPGDYVFLEVADTGRGIPVENLPRIFDPFFTTQFVGRGLGLSAALGIVRHHGGALGVRSEPGRGTSVRVYLPL